MRKIILSAALAASLLPATAIAQSLGEVRHDGREIQQDHLRLDRARASGNYDAARDARRDLIQDQRERREDWRDYRRAHPDVYRGPAYVGPRPGWRYRPVVVGYRFEPAYYGQRYWVDPVRYRLPVYGPGRRWVRYGNDVALVDVRSGRVVTVYNRFFY